MTEKTKIYIVKLPTRLGKGDYYMGGSQNEIKTVITTDEIRCILNNYQIGKKPLAKLLGWGETTIIRYMDGDIPTKEYSDKLFSILKSPIYYYEILIKNQSNLTNIAFKKSQRAVLGQMTKSKIRVIAQYFINLYKGQVSALQMQTLLYFSQAFYLAFYDKSIFEDEFRVNEDNIPYLEIYAEMNAQSFGYLKLEEEQLKEKEILDCVGEACSWYGSRTLAEMLKREKNQLRISRDKDNHKVVTESAMKSHMLAKMVQLQIKNVDEISNYIDQLFEEIKEISIPD